MKGIYFSERVKSKNSNGVGVENKKTYQIQCLKNLGELKVVEAVFRDGLNEKIKFLLPFVKSEREKQWEKILRVIHKDTDYIYIRKPSLSINFYRILKKIKDLYPNVFVMMEIPTYPFHSEYTGVSKVMNLKSIHCEKKLNGVVDRIVTYSDDDTIWGIPTMKMSNCVNYNEIKPRSEKYKIEPGVVRLTCVSNFMYWHGLDRLINGLKNYKGNYEIILNVVGGGQEIDNLKRLSEGMDNVIFHGLKTGVELDGIFDETDIAVDALGRHRSGVYYNSSLKGKEYVARGVPVISAVRTELDNMKDFSYYLKLPADESYIDIDAVVKFYEKVYSKTDSHGVTKAIRENTEKNFDYKYGFEKVVRNELLTRGKK